METSAADVPVSKVVSATLALSFGGFLVGAASRRWLALTDIGGRRRRRWVMALDAAGVTTLAAIASEALLRTASAPSVVVLLAAGLCATMSLLVGRVLDRLAGAAGLLLAVVAHVVTTVPLMRGIDPTTLPDPWAVAARGAPTWATQQLLQSVANHSMSGSLLPMLVLGVWTGIAAIGIIVLLRQVPLPTTSREARQVRRRTTVVLAAALTALLVGVLTLPRPALGTIAAANLATETSCVDSGTVTDLADLNRISTRVRGSDAFQGGDVGADVELQDGRRLGIFGDTLRSKAFDGPGMVRNSMLIFAPDCIRAVLPRGGGAIIPDRSSSAGTPVGYWPMSVGRLGRPGYDLIAVMAQRVHATGHGVFDFESLGPSVAAFVVPAGGVPQLVAQRDLGPDDSDPSRPEWGAAAAVHNGWLYLYGSARPDQKDTFGFALSVARVRPEKVTELQSWRYWDGTHWQRDASRAAQLIPAERGVSQTLSVFEQNGTWYALSKRDEFLGRDIAVWQAPNPWGPFDDGTTVAQLPSDAETGQLRYMPLAHPDLLAKPGTMVVSYSRNRTDFNKVIANPTEYRPRFIRVQLP